MLDQFIGQTLADKYRIDSVMRETDLGKVYHATHLLIDKGVAASRSDAGNVNVVIDELRGIDIVERALYQIGSRLT